MESDVTACGSRICNKHKLCTGIKKSAGHSAVYGKSFEGYKGLSGSYAIGTRCSICINCKSESVTYYLVLCITKH